MRTTLRNMTKVVINRKKVGLRERTARKSGKKKIEDRQSTYPASIAAYSS